MPPNFEKEFTIPLRQAIDKRVTKASLRGIQIATEETLKVIALLWPNDTFWSAANHTVSSVAAIPAAPVPPTRPEISGVLSGAASANLISNLEKLNALKFAQKVVISNPVPYAADVGHSTGNGLRIYTEAAAIGSVRAANKILSEGDL